MEDDRKRSAEELTNDQHYENPTHEPKRSRRLDHGGGDVAATFLPQWQTSLSATSDVAWTPEMHRSFVQAIFLLGMNRASPNVITQNMVSHPESLTAERIKSHLQKFRKNKTKSTQEFLAEYDAYVSQRLAERQMGARWNPVNPTRPLVGGEAAAHLSVATIAETNAHFASSAIEEATAYPFMGMSAAGVQLPYPPLSAVEAASPIGKALHHVMGLMQAMTDQLHAIRQQRQQLATASSPQPNQTLAPPVDGDVAPIPHNGEASSGNVRSTLRHHVVGVQQSSVSNSTFDDSIRVGTREEGGESSSPDYGGGDFDSLEDENFDPF